MNITFNNQKSEQYEVTDLLNADLLLMDGVNFYYNKQTFFSFRSIRFLPVDPQRCDR